MDFLQGKHILHKGNQLILADTALKKKVLILYYFTASFSETCRSFDLKLKEIYSEASLRKIELGILVISSDSNKNDYLNNYKTNYLEWFATPFDDEINQ